MSKIRYRIFEIIEKSKNKDTLSTVYDLFIIFVTITSLIPLCFKFEYPILLIIEKICVSIFILDYLFRWFTADFKLNKGIKSFFIYPFSFMAILDLLSIVPSFIQVNQSLKIIRVLRIIKTSKILRIFKLTRYSNSMNTLINVFNKTKSTLSLVMGIAVCWTLITALIAFNIEPDTFDTFFDAIYWSIMSLTTIGYGDICPKTYLGKLITIIFFILGLAIIALPTGVIAGEYLEEIREVKNNEEKN
jgi:voltage-gated potassium channel